MTNLIKTDFYKLFRSKGFYICTILLIAFTLMFDFLDYFSIKSQYNIVKRLPLSFSNLFLLAFISIAVSLFVAQDFSIGVIKNIASKVSKREYIFFSKFITATFITFIMLVASFLTILFDSLALWGFSELPQNFYPELLRMCGLEFLVFIAITAIFAIISFLTGKTGIAISINMCIVYVLSTVMGLLYRVLDKFFGKDTVLKCWIFAYPSTLAEYTLETDVIVRCSLVSIATIAIVTLLGILSIKRREIK